MASLAGIEAVSSGFTLSAPAPASAKATDDSAFASSVTGTKSLFTSYGWFVGM